MIARASGIVLLLALSMPLAAQQRVDRFEASTAASRQLARPPAAAIDSTGERSSFVLGAGGALGGVLLGTAGGFVAASIACASGSGSDDYCGLMAIPGFAVGETLGIPLGVWLADDMRGSLGTGMLASVGTMVAGASIAILAGDHAWIVIPFIPFLQIALAVSSEHATDGID